MIGFVLKHGAKADTPCGLGKETPLRLARRLGDGQILSLLERNLANLRLAVRSNRTELENLKNTIPGPAIEIRGQVDKFETLQVLLWPHNTSSLFASRFKPIHYAMLRP